MKYEQWLEIWLEHYVKPSAKRRTYDIYWQIAYKRVIPQMGGYDLAELSPMVIQRFVTDMLNHGNRRTGKGLSASTVNLVITIMQNSLKTAFDVGKIDDNLARKIKRPKLKQKSVSCFTIIEQKTIERAVLSDERKKMFGVLLCMYTGLRVGELLALTWSDVDFQRGVLSVDKTCAVDKSPSGASQLVDEPKTESSKRLIPIPKQLVPIMREMRRKRDSKYVVSQDGKSVGIRSYQRSFELLLERLNIKHKGFHSLRHTFATRALECGMDVKTLSEVLGHKNATVTLNRYAHSLLEHKTDMMNRVGKLFLQ